MIDVKNKWALITGASRGIGYLTAQFMAKQGCNLILHSRKREHTDTLLQDQYHRPDHDLLSFHAKND